MRALEIKEAEVWRLPQGLRRGPAWWRCPSMRFFGRAQVLAGAATIGAVILGGSGWVWRALAPFGRFLYGCAGPRAE